MTNRNENSRQIMTRAWAIFRATYRFPAVPFKSIGRPCFGWALKEAHREVRAAAAIAAIPAPVKAARVEAINRALVILDYRSDYSRASRERGALLAERNTLSA